MTKWNVPTLADVIEARRRIEPHLRPTALYGYPVARSHQHDSVRRESEKRGAFRIVDAPVCDALEYDLAAVRRPPVAPVDGGSAGVLDENGGDGG